MISVKGGKSSSLTYRRQLIRGELLVKEREMLTQALTGHAEPEISYGIYTIERLPKGSRRTPKWDLHSVAKDKVTAETHAKTLSNQPYYDHIEVQEFKTCPETKKRTVSKIRSYSRKSSKLWVGVVVVALLAIISALLF